MLRRGLCGLGNRLLLILSAVLLLYLGREASFRFTRNAAPIQQPQQQQPVANRSKIDTEKLPTVTEKQSVDNDDYLSPRELSCQLLKKMVQTLKGARSFQQLYTEIYRPYGFRLQSDDCTVDAKWDRLPLKYVGRQCPPLFAEWRTALLDAERQPDGLGPKRQIPAELVERFRTGNYSRLIDQFLANENWAKDPVGRTFTSAQLEALMERYTGGNYANFQHGNDGKAAVYAISEHKPAAMGRGIVIGSLTPWLEAALLYHGADHVTTVEYLRIDVQDSRLSYLHPKEYAANFKSHVGMDFAASFSSIEHSGLGRFGDHLDPDGDIKEVQKLRCVLRKGGLLYLGMPNGEDELKWNAERNYGPVRWPMITAGFKLEAIYYGEDPSGIVKSASAFSQAPSRHVTVVLRKLDD